MHAHHRHPTHIDRSRPIVAIQLLGGFDVTVDDVTTPTEAWTRRSAAALVKVLALAPGHRLHRERVMDLLWPDESPTDCAPRLHKAAHFARRALGHSHAVVLRNDIVHLFPGARLTVDTIEFERLAKTAVTDDDGDAARDALRWYRGELLPDDRYEEWAIDRRELLHLRRLDVLRVAEDWRELVEAEPSDEDAHVELMRAHIDAGDGAAALLQYEHLERVLDRELGVVPGREARSTCRDAGALVATATSARPTRPTVGSLLAELTVLMQRQSAVLDELAAAGVAMPAMAG